jgi:hypothetical protein
LISTAALTAKKRPAYTVEPMDRPNRNRISVAVQDGAIVAWLIGLGHAPGLVVEISLTTPAVIQGVGDDRGGTEVISPYCVCCRDGRRRRHQKSGRQYNHRAKHQAARDDAANHRCTSVLRHRDPERVLAVDGARAVAGTLEGMLLDGDATRIRIRSLASAPFILRLESKKTPTNYYLF